MRLRSLLFTLSFLLIGASANAQLAHGHYRLENGDIYASNGAGEVCRYASWDSYVSFGGRQGDWVQLGHRFPRGIRYGGICTGGVSIPDGQPPHRRPRAHLAAGSYRVGETIYYVNGAGAYCVYANMDDYLRMNRGQSNWIQIYELPYGMHFGGTCTGN